MKAVDVLDFIDFSKYKSILCLDGDIPRSDFFLSKNLPIIAADGAANRLYEMGIRPDFLIGDFDSVRPELLSYTPNSRSVDQNFSDFQKAIEYLKENELVPMITCGISGGYLDHIINNVGIIVQLPHGIFVDSSIIGFCLKKGEHRFSFPFNAKISIFGMPSCRISTTGLRWELNNSTLVFPGYSSCLNRVLSKKLLIKVIEGLALVTVYRSIIIDAGIE
ncbi:MAG: thiamine diphosphokinase [Holosporales bacterium]|jgi:thiamine pyrophosphokinase|nr:thiamine diphosphokinase [Holosporales bacterium]